MTLQPLFFACVAGWAIAWSVFLSLARRRVACHVHPMTLFDGASSPIPKTSL